jgi:hypothetical protein
MKRALHVVHSLGLSGYRVSRMVSSGRGRLVSISGDALPKFASHEIWLSRAGRAWMPRCGVDTCLLLSGQHGLAAIVPSEGCVAHVGHVRELAVS